MSHEVMGMALAKMGVATILDGKAYHIIMLPEQLSKQQIEYFFENREFFDNLDHTIRTMVYCEQKTGYGDRYRKLHKEAIINGIKGEKDSTLLFNEIEGHLQNLTSKRK